MKVVFVDGWAIVRNVMCSLPGRSDRDARTPIHTHTFERVYMSLPTYIYIYIFIYLPMYIYRNKYTYVYIYIYIYI